MEQQYKAKVSHALLAKVGRLFTNRLDHIFVELLQNARRAGATRVEVSVQPLDGGVKILLADNGAGIEDFGKLLHLGDSNWEKEIVHKEDPAGIGFFSLANSGVVVRSRGLRAEVPPDAFKGSKPMTVVDDVEPVLCGTTLEFNRDGNTVETVRRSLQNVAKYGPLIVTLNGEMLQREDFLADAIYVREYNGVRIGVVRERNKLPCRTALNFYGSVIAVSSAPELSGVCDYRRRGSLFLNLDVLDTSLLRLKLPDRTAVVQDEAYDDLMRQAEVVLYEALATFPEHFATYEQYCRAKELGVQLKESSAELRPFFVPSAWADAERRAFSVNDRSVDPVAVSPTSSAIAMFGDLSDSRIAFTFDVAAQLHKLPGGMTAVKARQSASGYGWYGNLPVLKDFDLRIDGVSVATSVADVEKWSDQWNPTDDVSIVDSITLSFDLVHPDGVKERIEWDLPFAGWADGSDFTLVVTKDTDWAKKENPYAGPSGLLEAAEHLAFDVCEDGDMWETQQEDFRTTATSGIAKCLGGPMAHARVEVARVLESWSLRDALKKAQIRELRISSENGSWTYDLEPMGS